MICLRCIVYEVGSYNGFYQVDVACGKHGAANGLSPGKGYLFLFPSLQ